jgi:hypothetical protein
MDKLKKMKESIKESVKPSGTGEKRESKKTMKLQMAQKAFESKIPIEWSRPPEGRDKKLIEKANNSLLLGVNITKVKLREWGLFGSIVCVVKMVKKKKKKQCTEENSPLIFSFPPEIHRTENGSYDDGPQRLCGSVGS